MRITRVEPTKHDPDRVAIHIDGKYALACHVLLWMQSGWHVEDEIDEADLARLDEAEAIRALQDRALNLLASRPRGRVELQRRLVRATKSHPAPPAAQVQTVLDNLTEQGYLDDRAFAEYWVEQRDHFRPKGSLALRAELGQQGVDKADAEAALQPERDLERALSAARRKAQALANRPGIDARGFRDHLGPFLQRRGFNYGVARDAIATLWQECQAGDNETMATELGDFAEDGE